MSTSTSLMTFAEFEQLQYTNSGKMELVNGEVIKVMPPPELAHMIAARAIFLMLAARFKERAWFDHRVSYGSPKLARTGCEHLAGLINGRMKSISSAGP